MEMLPAVIFTDSTPVILTPLIQEPFTLLKNVEFPKEIQSHGLHLLVFNILEMKRQIYISQRYGLVYFKMTNLLQVKINLNFMKSNYIIQNKQKLELWHFKKCVCKALQCLPYNWILLSASAFNFLEYVALVEAYEENPLSHRQTCNKKERVFLQPFQIILDFLILY